MSDDNAVPASPDGYKPLFERREGVPEGVTIDTNHPRFKSAAEVAHKARLTQAQFSALLGHEVETAVKAQRAATPALAPAAAAPAQAAKPAKVEGYAGKSFAQRLAAGGHL